MARKALVVKATEKPKFKSRVLRRCWRCGRIRSVLRKFGLCRICFVQLVDKGEVPGVKKSSW